MNRGNQTQFCCSSRKFKASGQLAKFRRLGVGFLTLLLMAGCADFGQVKNEQITDAHADQEYALHTWKEESNSSEVSILLTFSGGGTRAAALAYGVMQELRDTIVVVDGQKSRLLDEVDYISSVSGGSFTSAYYGLHGDGLFETFEEVFLRYDVDKQLELQLINPVLWFSKEGRTDAAIKVYQDKIFHDAVFADMNKPGRPMVIINASDLSYGVRFSFVQEYFDLLCSDLTTFPVARAVAASSAVPVLFEPVVLKNYSTCSEESALGAQRVREFAGAQDPEDTSPLATNLMSYSDKDSRKFIHLVDGGITDNLGLRALTDVFKVAGGADAYMHKRNQKPPRRMVVIAVNAANQTHHQMDQSAKQPHIGEVMSAVSSIQIGRYEWATTALVEEHMGIWASQLSTKERPVSPYFVEVHLASAAEKKNDFFSDLPLDFDVSHIPTSFTLTDQQVDFLIDAGRKLLRAHPVYQQLLADMDRP